DVPVPLHLDGDVVALLPGLLLGEPDAGDLRVGEGRRRHVLVRQPAQVVRVEQVVAHGAHLGVGDVLEHVRGGDVAQRPHALGGGGAAVLVDGDPAVRGHLDAGGGEVELVGGGDASGGDEQDLPGDGGAVVEPHAHPVVGLLGPDRGAPGDHLVALGGELVEPVAQVGVQTPQQRGAGDDGDLGAERLEDVGELHGD